MNNTKNITTLPKPQQEYVGSIPVPYGRLHIDKLSAKDHALMRGEQLSGLILLMQGGACESFRACNSEIQTNLLWLAMQLADELTGMIDLVAAEAREVAA